MASVKRENNTVVLSCNNIILDIEGTTTSITFVKDVLFPYVKNHLETYVQENWESEGFQAIINALRIQAKDDKEQKLDGVVDIPESGEKEVLAKAVIESVLWQMSIDSKAKSLKDLQGLIMEIGYQKGEIKGHVYDDFEPNLKSWTELGKNVYIYSSGSVQAQKLLYGHSEKGDLLQYIKGHFDTTVGKKDHTESYKKIIEQIAVSPSDTVFFTDVPKEAKAAKEAGLLAILLSREGNAPLTDEDKQEFQVIKSFSEIQFENTSKKRKVCTDDDEKNDNKSVESCEVSLTPLKEPIPQNQSSDVSMEVEESESKEENCNLVKNDVLCTSVNTEKLSNVLDESNDQRDVEMKPTEELTIENDSEEGSEEAQANENIIDKKGDSGKSQVESNCKIGNKNSSDPIESAENCQENIESVVDKTELKKGGDEEKPCDKEKQTNIEKTSSDSKKSCQDEMFENGKKLADQIDSNTKIHQNGDLTTNGAENKSISEVDESNDGTNLKPDIEVNNGSNHDLVNESNPVTDEKDLKDDKILSDSSHKTVNGSHTFISEEKLLIENDIKVNEKTCPKEKKTSEKPSNEISHDVESKGVDTDTDKQNLKSTKTGTEDVTISENITNSKKAEEINCELKRQNGFAYEPAKSGDIATSKPCIAETAGKPLFETGNVVDVDKDKSEKMEVDEVSTQMNKNCEIDNSKSDTESCTQTSKNGDDAISKSDTVVDPENGSVSDETQIQSDINAEPCNEVKKEVSKSSLTADEKVDSILNEKLETVTAEIRNSVNDESCPSDKKEENISVNGKVENSPPIKCVDDKQMQNGTDEACEGKKFKDAEGTVITADVEA